ncbi:MAG: hypothetical protein AAF802_29070 [Planctomycetota bacterium]
MVRRHSFRNGAIGCLGIAASLSVLNATKIVTADWPFWGRTRVCNKKTVRPYNYSGSREARVGKLDLVDRIGVPKTLTVSEGEFVQVRSYHGARDRIEIGGLRVDQIGLSLNDAGSLASSCRLAFNGETERALHGTNVTLRLRAYAGGDSTRVTSAALPMVWESTRQVWVPTGRDIKVEIAYQSDHRVAGLPNPDRAGHATPVDLHASDTLTRRVSALDSHFDQIRVFELIVERHSDW